MDINESYELMIASRQKGLAGIAKEMDTLLIAVENYIETRTMEKGWENFFDKSKKPNQILVAEDNHNLTPLAVLNCANDSLSDKFLKYRNSGKIDRESRNGYYVVGFNKHDISAIWHLDTLEFLDFWTYLLGRGMRLEIWEDSHPVMKQRTTRLYTLDFE